MSAPAPASSSFFISGINHCELQAGQQLTLEHLRSLQQQLAEQAGRARALQQQIQQQAAQQGLRAGVPGAVAVKAEPGAAIAPAAAGVKKEEEGTQPAQQHTAQQTQQQLQYATLLALQLQQQQQARAAAAVAAAAAGQAQGRGAAAAAPAGFGGAPAALAHNVFPQPGGGRGRGGGGRGAGRQSKQSRVEEPATDQWVQCSKCQTWRQVPDEFWPDIENADEDEDWTCKDALWDVEDYEPNTAACC